MVFALYRSRTSSGSPFVPHSTEDSRLLAARQAHPGFFDRSRLGLRLLVLYPQHVPVGHLRSALASAIIIIPGALAAVSNSKLLLLLVL